MSSGPILYPNVTSLPGQAGVGQSERLPRKQEGVKGEFDQVFERTLGNAAGTDLNQVKAPLKFSAHATQRLNDRKINLDQATMAKVTEAIDKAEAKGIEDTLVLTDKAALIVSVKNRTVITAMDKNSMTGNVFTNIDGAVFI
ncbi:MAG: hypothetical protein NDJ90_13990 [Oligoflexia bacterium]|nr:hypothetical protein [Oligoflexia bacterium]